VEDFGASDGAMMFKRMALSMSAALLTSFVIARTWANRLNSFAPNASLPFNLPLC